MATLHARDSIATTAWQGDEAVFDGSQWLNCKCRPVVVLDSGVGGLTLVRQLERLLPTVSILYVADNQWFPYGSKSSTAVADRVRQLFDHVCTLVNPLALVIACNTASIAILEHGPKPLPQRYFLVTPPLEEALQVSAQGKIVLLATPGTLGSKNIRSKLANVSRRARIWGIATQSLVTLSESKLSGKATPLTCFSALVDRHLTTQQRLAIDTVILGCTHFPHLVEDLKTVFPSASNWIDPAKKVALQIASALRSTLSPSAAPLRAAIFTGSLGNTNYPQIFFNHGFRATHSFLHLKNLTPTRPYSITESI